MPTGVAIGALLLSALVVAPSQATQSLSADDFSMSFAAASSQYATSATEVIPMSGPFTVSVWVLDDTANDDDWRHILSQGQGGTAFYLGTNQFTQEIRAGDSWVATGVDLPVGEWAHLALVADGAAATLYLNGQAAATTNSFQGPSASGMVFQVGVGRQVLDDQCWNGLIDQVKIYSAALDAAAIAADMHSYGMYTGGSITAADHVAFYDFNDGPAGTAATAVPNRVDGADANTNLTAVNDPVYQDVAEYSSDGDDSIVVFPRSYLSAVGGWQPPSGVTTIRALLVGGGGGGGASNGGGGGSGGVYDSQTDSVAISTGVQAITVGQCSLGARFTGGAFVYGSNTGQTTSAFGLTAGGGGLGGTSEANRASGADGAPGSAGGSGGGGASDDTHWGGGGLGGSGTPAGNVGGDGVKAPAGSGGGGGAFEPGGTANPADPRGLFGGDGISSNITGADVFYAGGGGGGNLASDAGPSFGGEGGGGDSAGEARVAESGTANTGGGGGAGNKTEATARGGNGASGLVIARFDPTPSPAPPPAPVFPPSAPTSVLVEPGDASALLTWSAPSSPGSFPITSYQVQVQPGSHGCLVAVTQRECEITDLVNDTTYTASVRALNGAGWGPFSAASASFTPVAPVVASVTITGARGEVRGRPGVRVHGVTTGLEFQTVQSHVRLAGEPNYRHGSVREIGQDGAFTWQRRTGKKVYVSFSVGDVRSNRVIIARALRVP